MKQLGGLVMWVPGGIAYLVAGLPIATAWLAPRLDLFPVRGAVLASTLRHRIAQQSRRNCKQC